VLKLKVISAKLTKNVAGTQAPYRDLVMTLAALFCNFCNLSFKGDI
jgi:hypothetical protein